MKGIRRLLFGGAALLVVALAACTPPPTTTPTSTTTTTAAPSGNVRFDFHDHMATVGGAGSCANCAEVDLLEPDGVGHDLFIRVRLLDINEAADGGYSWQVINDFVVANPDGPGALDCHYPLVQARARANIGDGTSTSVTYRMDFDGHDPDSTLRDLPGSWDYDAGNRPTMYVESVTLDIAATPSCRVLN